jgi:hypothetical protein
MTLLNNKYTYIVIVTISIVVSCIMYGKSCEKEKMKDLVITTQTEVIRQKGIVHEKYNRLPDSTVDDMQRILRGESLEGCSPYVPLHGTSKD